MAGKRINLAELADEPPLDEARVPGFADATPRSKKVGQVAANPLNTRDVHASPAKITSIKESILLHGQLQPSTVVTRSAFLAIFPEYEELVAGAVFVQVTGGRRRAAIIEAGLPTIDITVKNDLAESRAKFISATAAENIDREDYDPIEEARAVELLVKECGTGKAVAEQLGRTEPWVTQRRNLLKLAPEIQEALRGDEETRLPLREARNLHKLSVDEQLVALTAWRDGRVPVGLTAVNPTGADPGAPGEVQPKAARPTPASTRPHAPALSDLADRLTDRFDTRVKVDISRRKGRITIEFDTVDDLERIVGIIGVGDRAQRE